MKIIAGGITAPSGFKAGGISCGIKKQKEKDLALIYSETPAAAAGLFTKNKVQAAHIKVTRDHLRDNKAQAIIVNSGNANCCNGRKGVRDAVSMVQFVAKGLGIDEIDVLVASTGEIGTPLPIEKIRDAVPTLIERLDSNGGTSAAQAIMTTDKISKEIAVKIKIDKIPVTIGGMAKGAGMISPHLATMLAFFATDADIMSSALKKALKLAVDKSFNSITVDGDMSTNDTVLILANGRASNPILREGDNNLSLFSEALSLVALELSKMVVRDAEGATKFIEVQVMGAKTSKDAQKVARDVSNSNLIKTMIFGGDPNWGRIAARVGASSADIKEEKLDIYLGNIAVLKNGSSVGVKKDRLKKIFREDQMRIAIDLKIGDEGAIMWTCDLSEEYVRINAGYSALSTK